jgi:hypothetical protein
MHRFGKGVEAVVVHGDCPFGAPLQNESVVGARLRILLSE